MWHLLSEPSKTSSFRGDLKAQT